MSPTNSRKHQVTGTDDLDDVHTFATECSVVLVVHRTKTYRLSTGVTGGAEKKMELSGAAQLMLMAGGR